MTRRRSITVASVGRPHPWAASGRALPRVAFTILELLVVMAIIVILLSLAAAAMSAARASSKKQQTQLLIEKLDAIVQQQFATYGSRSMPATRSPNDRSLALRRLASADMPDSWGDVRLIESGTAVAYVSPSGMNVCFPTSSSQRVYASVLRALSARKNQVAAANASQISATAEALQAEYGDAECLFLIVMYGGFADCVECGSLRNAKIMDLDNDAAYEFVDEWNKPIRYVLWPAKFELPPGTPFFSSDDIPFLSGGGTTSARGLRPLLFSGGPDATNSTAVNGTGNLVSGTACGLPSAVPFGGPELSSGLDGRADNLTNFDREARK